MSVKRRKPLPVYLSVPGLAFQGCGMFFLPFLVALAAGMLFEVSEVVDTLPALLLFTALILFPITGAQLLGVILKSRREIGFWRGEKQLTLTRLFDILYRHIRVITIRGWMVLVGGCFFTLLSLGLKWASFGTMAVLGLLIFYLVTGWTLFVATFLVRTFERGMGRARSGIDRQMMPAVTLQGETVEEVLRFRQVPVPWGYYLLVEDPNHPRLMTESRYAVGASARGGEVELRGRLRATPRGHFHLGPASLWYQDFLGITKVSVASAATAELKVLPRFRPVQIVEPPKTPMQTPDVLTRPHRFPTEDYFRFREYTQGDDTRRIQWRLSLRSGRLQVRLPETREISTHDVLLVLDTYLPPGKLLDAAHGADEILDALVEAWLGIARELIERGDRVTLVAAASGHQRDEVLMESIPCRSGQAARWQDLGARAHWQGRFDIPAMLTELGDGAHGVIVTARFTAPPPGPLPGQSMTWLFLDPADAMPPEPGFLSRIMGSALRPATWAFTLPHPVGSEDNALPRRLVDAWQIWELSNARFILRGVATIRAGRTLKELQARQDAIYRIERKPTSIRLVGLRGLVGPAKAAR